MSRRFFRRPYYPGSRKSPEYSNETFINRVRSVGVATDFHQSIMPQANIIGMRKVKNFGRSAACDVRCGAVSSETTHCVVLWALVYVPEGIAPSRLTDAYGDSDTAPASIYDPNQNVIMSGMWGPDPTDQYTRSSNLARNMNSGDQLMLLLRVLPPFGAKTSSIKWDVRYVVNFAIAS